MLIRPIQPEDAKYFQSMLLELDKETAFMMYEPGERPENIEKMRERILNIIECGNLMLVAVSGNDVVGFLSAERGRPNRIKHTAYIVTGIRQAFQGMGIGTSFFKELDKWVGENLITRLELTVMCPNTIARHLYEKNGFIIEGVKKNAMLVNKEYVDEYYMAKLYSN